MHERRNAGSAISLAFVIAAFVPHFATAQEAVTVTGHVSANDRPVQGASVRIAQLNIGATTDADGRYSFIVPSSRVRGQTVTITARQLRFDAQSAEVMLTGGPLVQD